MYAGYYDQKSNAFPVNATFGLGTATIGSNGQASYTCYFPFDGAVWINNQWVDLSPFSGSGTGSVNKNGVFNFLNGVSGYCQLWGKAVRGVLAPMSVGLGVFADGYGSGVFGVIKYQ